MLYCALQCGLFWSTLFDIISWYGESFKAWCKDHTQMKCLALVLALLGSYFGYSQLSGFGTLAYPVAIWFLMSLYWKENKVFTIPQIVIYSIALSIDCAVVLHHFAGA
ncbi:hypothetical protein CF8_0201 [Aeromonas phage CF8]|nr:hypothetical protein CF8_0201 [Aeromonas phage CF8]